MKIILPEKQILTTIRLSGTQKAVLTKIIASSTEEQAYEQISDGRNLVAARDILKKLGLIEFEEGSATVTDTGKQVMKDENLLDDSDQLTDEGQQFAQSDGTTEIKQQPQGQAPMEPAPEEGGDDLGLGDEEGGEDISLEGKEFTMLKDIHNAVREKELKENWMDQYKITPQDLAAIKQAQIHEDDLPDSIMDKLYYFVNEYDPSWMPYGTQKARDGDPHEWIYDHLDEIVAAINKSARK